jgi:hypothetical protein
MIGIRRVGGCVSEQFALFERLRSEPEGLCIGASRQVWEHSNPAVEAPRYSITFGTMANGA